MVGPRRGDVGSRSESRSGSYSYSGSGSKSSRRSNANPQGTDEFGGNSDSSRYTTATFLAALVPTAAARRAITVSVETDRAVYERGEDVAINVEFGNRLPIPVDIPTPRQRRWGWTVDGELEASDERRYVRERPSSFSFRGGERKRASVTWSGRFERTRDRHEFVLSDPGEYEIRAFVATHEDRYRPSDSTTIRIE